MKGLPLRCRLVLPLVGLLFLASCTPSFEHLVGARRYADAVCRTQSEKEAQRIAEVVERDAELRVHGYAARPAELTSALGERGAEIAGKVTFVRLRVAANTLPMQGSPRATLQVEKANAIVDVSGAGRPSDAAAALLFALTEERIPGDSTYVDEAKLKKEIMWTVFTFGLKPLLFGFDKVTEKGPPDRAIFLRNGPLAMTLFDGLNGPGDLRVLAVPTPLANTAWLDVQLKMHDSDEEHQRCTLDLRYTLPLAQRGQTLTASLDALFADGARSAVALGGKRTYALANRFGAWKTDGP